MRLSAHLFLLILFASLWHCTTIEPPDAQKCRDIARKPALDPDYSDVTIPANIAPMNFAINEKGNAYYVELSSAQDKKITLSSRSNSIRIPIKKWHRILEKNRGENLDISIYVRDKNGEWNKYQTVTNKISSDDIEPYLAYRLIKPLYVYWDQMGIYQRDLTSFSERPIFLNRSTGDNCINCHSFHNHNPDRFL